MTQRPVLMIIGAGIDQMPAYIEARNLGLETIAVDYDPNAPSFEVANHTLVISTKDIDQVVAAAKQFHNEVKPISGVLTLGAEVSQTVSAVAATLGLPGVPEHVAYLTTNKCARAEVLAAHNVNFPKFISGKTLSDFKDASFPAIIKPSDNSASRGVRIIDSPQDLEDYFETALAFASDGQVILEEFIPGDQISIEGIVIEGQLRITAIADRNYSRNDTYYPFMIEDGGEMPSRQPAHVLDAVCAEFEKSVHALGISLGPTKGDIIIRPDGTVFVIEVTSRLSGGGFCSRVVPMTTGVEILRPTIQQAIGAEIDTDVLEQKFQNGMCHRFYFHKAGTITSVSGLEQLKRAPGVRDLVFLQPISVGDELAPVTYANRLFYVITVADNREEAIALAEGALGEVEITTRKQPFEIL